MADINLLPDDLRKKEENLDKKKESTEKIRMSVPKKEEETKQPLKKAKPSFLSKLFNRHEPVSGYTGVDSSVPGFEKENSEFKKPSQPKKVEELHLPEVKHTAKAHGFTSTAEEENQENKKKEGSEKKQSIFSWLCFWRSLSRGQRTKKYKMHISEKKIQPKKDKEKKRKEKNAELDINLIPAEMEESSGPKSSKKLIISSSIVFTCVLLVAIIYLGITWYQIRMSQQIGGLSQQISVIDKEIAQSERLKDEALALQKRLELIRDLLGNHVYWTQFFSLLEKNTIDDVYYTSFSMAGREKLVISAATKDYHSVARQLVAFQQAADFVKEVRIDAASAEINEIEGTYVVSFNINLEFLPKTFWKPIK